METGEVNFERIAQGLVVLSSLLVLGSLITTGVHVHQYLQNWTQPKIQILVIRVLALIPIWALLALLNVGLPQLRYFVGIFLDLYEGFAILSFMQLIYTYLGGKDQARWKASGKHPYRCFGCCCLLIPGEKMMKVSFYSKFFLIYLFIYLFMNLISFRSFML